MSLFLEFGPDQPILPHYHLVKEERVFVNPHLLTNGMITTQPDVCLLGDGRVEVPSTIWLFEIFEHPRITILLTPSVGNRVLAGEMEDIDRKANVLEVRVIANNFREMAIVVEEDVVGLERVVGKCSLDKLLYTGMHKYCYGHIVIDEFPLTATLETASAP